MEVLTAISSLLQGPTEVGQKLLTREGVLQVMIAMAASSDVVHQVENKQIELIYGQVGIVEVPWSSG